MSRMITALCILVCMVGFVGFHTQQIKALDREVGEICDRVENAYREEAWTDIGQSLQSAQERWNQSRFWVCMTIDTAEIEEIEISLQQCKNYAAIRAKEDFIGEFTMLRMKLAHLPYQEGFRLEELL